MARDYARLLCSLWNNTDFRNRSRAGQHLYMLVLSQSTMSHAGVVPLTARRWASATDGVTVADIHDALDEMDRTRFLVVDEDTEEVMVRSYLRNDLVLTNPNLAVAAVRAYEQIGSPKLRAAWVAELARLDVERRTAANPPKAWTDPRSAPLLAKVLADPLPEVPPPSHEPPSVEPPTERGSERGSVTPPPEGGVPTRTRASRAAPAPAPAPATTPLAPADANARKTQRPRDELWDTLMAACGIDTTAIPKSARGAYNTAVADLRHIGATPAQVTLRAHRYRHLWPNASLTPTALARRWSELSDGATKTNTGSPNTPAPARDVLAALDRQVAADRADLADLDFTRRVS